MRGLWALLLNENMKIYYRKRTWILASILLLLVVGLGFIEHHSQPEVSQTQWKAKAHHQIQVDQMEMKKSSPVLRSNLNHQIIQLQYDLKHNVFPYEKNSWTFMKDATVLVMVITLFAVIVSSDIVSSEFTWGSIKMLMVRPHHRWRILLSKYLASILFTILLFLELIVLSWVMGGFLFGFGSFHYTNIIVSDSSHVIKQIASVHSLEDYGLRFLHTMMIISIAFMISTLFRSSGLAIGISIFLLFAVNLAGPFLSVYEWTKYLPFLNFDLSQYLNGNHGLIKGMTLSFSLLMDFLYWLVFMIVTWLIFQKRDIAN